MIERIERKDHYSLPSTSHGRLPNRVPRNEQRPCKESDRSTDRKILISDNDKLVGFCKNEGPSCSVWLDEESTIVLLTSDECCWQLDHKSRVGSK
jgi:hypothetical protein